MKIKKLTLLAVGGEEFRSIGSNILLLLARIALGGMMAFAHGLGKVPPSEGFIKAVGGLGFPLPSFFAFAAGLSEFLCALFVALGLATRLNSLFVCFTMFVAAFGRHLTDPFAKKELALVYLFSFLIFVATGAGKLSVDQILRNKLSQ